jgi:hypothetical protein
MALRRIIVSSFTKISSTAARAKVCVAMTSRATKENVERAWKKREREWASGKALTFPSVLFLEHSWCQLPE